MKPFTGVAGSRAAAKFGCVAFGHLFGSQEIQYNGRNILPSGHPQMMSGHGGLLILTLLIKDILKPSLMLCESWLTLGWEKSLTDAKMGQIHPLARFTA
jgi:hypothetical protein